MNRRNFVAGGLCALAAPLAPAQSFPTRPIRLVVAAAPGGTSDFLARLIGEQLQASMGQPVVVDNRGGGGGTLAPGIVAKSGADGHTLALVSASHGTSSHLYSRLPYDPQRDFAPVTQLINSFFVVAVPSSLPANTFAEFIELAKQKKGQLNYSSAGNGQVGHLGMELLKRQAGFDAVHVPYVGLGPATAALIAGTVDVSLLSLPSSLPHAQAGRLKLLAVTGSKRSQLLPNVPTVAEAGVPGYELTAWQGILAPAGTPAPIVHKLQQEIARALKQPSVMQKLAGLDLEPVGSAPEEFARFIQADGAKWEPVIKAAGVKAD